MAITEDSRYRLHQRLTEVLGEDEASVLMEHLPPVGWADVATKRDLDHQTQLMTRDLQSFRSEMRGEFATFRSEMRGEFATFQTGLIGEFASFRSEVRGELAASGAKVDHVMDGLRVEFHRELRGFLFAVMGMNATLVALVFAAVRLA